MRILVVIPAHNEAESIRSTVQQVIDAGYDYIVINDGSTDETAEICRQNGFNCISLCENLGIGGAIQAGHLYALKHGYDADVQFDGDGQHDVNYISELMKGLEAGNDLVIGSRFVQEVEGFRSTHMRRFGIKCLKVWIKLFTGTVIYDSTSGFRACGRRAIELFAQRYPFDYPEPESIVLALLRGLTVTEVPAVMHERQGGTSSISGFSSAYYMLKVMLAIAILRVSSGKGRK